VAQFFAYGLEVNFSSMRGLVGRWRRARRAVLPGYRLAFDVPDEGWGGVVANVKRSGGSEVHGVLYELDEEQLDSLSQRSPFIWIRVRVSVGHEGVEAWTLQAPEGVEGRPPTPYLSRLLWALREQGAPRAYLDGVAALALGAE
jgi:hypothetical protein